MIYGVVMSQSKFAAPPDKMMQNKLEIWHTCLLQIQTVHNFIRSRMMDCEEEHSCSGQPEVCHKWISRYLEKISNQCPHMEQAIKQKPSNWIYNQIIQQKVKINLTKTWYESFCGNLALYCPLPWRTSLWDPKLLVLFLSGAAAARVGHAVQL